MSTPWPTPLGGSDGARRAAVPIARGLAPLARVELAGPAPRALAIGPGDRAIAAGDPAACVAGGAIAWRAPAGRVGDPAVAGDLVIAAEERGAWLRARDAATGEVAWQRPGPGWLFDAPVPLADGAVAALRMTERGGVAMELVGRGGASLGARELGGSALGMVARGGAPVIAVRGELIGLDPAGEVSWRATAAGFGGAPGGAITAAPLVRGDGSIVIGWSTASGPALHAVDPDARTVAPIARRVPALGCVALAGAGAAEALVVAHERTLVRIDPDGDAVEAAYGLSAPAALAIGSPCGAVLVAESWAPSYWDSYREAYGLRVHLARFGADGGVVRWEAPGPITAMGVDGAGRAVVYSGGALHVLGGESPA